MLMLIAFFLKFVLHIDIVPEETQEFVIHVCNTRILDSIDEATKTLDETYSNISVYLIDTSESKNEIIRLYHDVTNAPVCSEANRYFNSLADCFELYEQELSNIQSAISLYEENYNACLDLISRIPLFSTFRDNKYNEFIDRFETEYQTICEKKQKYLEDKEELYSLYLDAKQTADELFEEYYPLMCHIVYAEAGICPFMEQCYVANTIENRIKHKEYPNTIHGVIYDSGQYEPVMTGSINMTPSKAVKENMELYLRGKVETEMPDNVVFQALFEQGHGKWKVTPLGHYFCYY